MGKRGYGSGSMREKRPGVFELRVGGRSRAFHGTRKGAERALAAFVAEAATAPQRAQSSTLQALVDDWLAAADIEDSTRATYLTALAHLPPRLASTRLSRLTLRDFDRAYAEMTRAGVSGHQVRKLHTALCAALREGVRWQLLSHHPARGAHLPALADRQVAPPSIDVLDRILAEAERSDLQTAVWLRLVLASGARRGEVLALRWSDVDLDARSVRISASMNEDRTLKVTKTNRVRTVALDATTIADLRRWRAGQEGRAAAVGVDLIRDPWVLSQSADSSVPWRPDGATQRFRRVCRRAGVTGVRLHDLRHAHATMLLRGGVDVRTVAGRLGHAKTSTTLDVYSHVLDGADRAAAEAMGRLLGGA